MLLIQTAQNPLAGMAKRRMTDIMSKRNGFNQTFIESQHTADISCDA